jgi:fumarate reductase subunit D
MIFIVDLIACSTCFGHHYVHHQELESITQKVAACGIWCFGVQVVGMVLSRGQQPANRKHKTQLNTIPTT